MGGVEKERAGDRLKVPYRALVGDRNFLGSKEPGGRLHSERGNGEVVARKGRRPLNLPIGLSEVQVENRTGVGKVRWEECDEKGGKECAGERKSCYQIRGVAKTTGTLSTRR